MLRHTRHSPSVGPAVSVPPPRAARSRRPVSPYPAPAAASGPPRRDRAAAGWRPATATSRRRELKATADRLPRRVLARVGQRLLRGPVHGQADLRADRARRAGHGELDRRVAVGAVLRPASCSPAGRAADTASPRSARMARRASASALPGEGAGALDALDRLGEFRAPAGSSPSSPSAACEVHRHGGERVREHVVDLAGDPRPLGQRRRLRFRGVRPAGLFQRLFGLLGAQQVGAAGQAERPQPDERPGSRPACRRRAGRERR